MPKVISQEQKDKAKSLREQGLSYKEIAVQVGLSERWCKVNLSDVVKKESVLLDELCTKSKSNHGVSKGEVAKAFDIYDMPKETGVKVLNSKVKLIRKKDKKNNIVRPDWMVPDMAQIITQEVIETSLVLEDRCNEAAFELWCYLKGSGCKPETLPSVMKIKNAMMSIAAAACSNAPGTKKRLQNWLDSLASTADALSVRNEQVKVTVTGKCMMPDLSDIEEFIL